MSEPEKLGDWLVPADPKQIGDTLIATLRGLARETARRFVRDSKFMRPEDWERDDFLENVVSEHAFEVLVDYFLGRFNPLE